MALAAALQKLEATAGHVDNHVAEQNPATAHMFIINPLHVRKMDNLFSTHPNTSNRVKALQELAEVFTQGRGVRSNPWSKAY